MSVLAATNLKSRLGARAHRDFRRWVDSEIHEERDKTAELGDLHGKGLDVDAVDRALDKAELPSEVGTGGVEPLAGLFLYDSGGVGKDTRFPVFVAVVEFVEHVDELLEHAHGKGAGTAGGVKNGRVVDGIDQDTFFIIGKSVFALCVGKEDVEPFLGISPQ